MANEYKYGSDGDIKVGFAAETVITDASVSRAIDIQVTPTTADRQLYMVVDYGSNTKEAAYITAKSAKTSGETIGIRGRAENQAAGASTGEARGMFGQGIATAALNAGTVTGVQSEAIAKDTSTVVTVRGAFFAADSEGTPTSITNMYGQWTRVKTSVAPGTDFICAGFETEKFGTGIKADSMMYFKTSTWTNSETAVAAVIDMSGMTGKCDCHIRFGTAHTANETTIEGDFWYDATNHTFQYYDNAGVKTIATV